MSGQNLKTSESDGSIIKVADNKEEKQQTKPTRMQRPKRDGRVSLHKQKRIRIEKEDGYYYRLVNDVDDRVARFKKAGYEVVEKKLDKRGADASEPSQMGSTATQPVGSGKTGVYMRIPQEWHDDDQAEKQLENDRIMNQIEKGHAGAQLPGQFGRVSIDDQTKRRG